MPTRMGEKSNPRALTRMDRGLPIVGAVPSMAEGTAGVESAGGAEKAAAVGLEALEPGAYGGAGCWRD